MKLVFLSFALLCVIIKCYAYPTGAPETACSSLTPVHPGISAQTSTPPYQVSAEKFGDKIRVTISSPIGEQFEGFVLQARSQSDPTKLVEGEFSSGPGYRTIDCSGGLKNTLTHTDRKPKKEVVTEWTSKGAAENVIFRATVAKTYALFWTEIDSEQLSTDKNSPVDPENLNCLETKYCFSLPTDDVVLTYSRTPNGVEFKMKGKLSSSMYMAMGLSNDSKMGEDSVTECIREQSDVIVRESWNKGNSNTLTKELSSDQYESSAVDGWSICSWTKPYKFEFNGHKFDFVKNNYYILLAKGAVSNGELRYHDQRQASKEAENFTSALTHEERSLLDSAIPHGDEHTPFQHTPTASYAFNDGDDEMYSTPPDDTKTEKSAANRSFLSLCFLLLAIAFCG